jgi:hemolysin activation/secretion protein
MSKTPEVRLALTLAITALYLTQLALPVAKAQNVPQIPTQSSPGLVIPSPNDQVLNEQRKIEDKQVPAQTEAVPEVKIEVTQPSSSIQLQTTTFVANQITIENSTFLTDQDKERIIQPYLGKQITLTDLEKLVEEINTIYRDRGYLTTQAYIPPQEVDNGVIKISVVEGRAGQVCIVGGKYYKAKALERNLKLYPGELLDVNVLEKAINRSNQVNNFALRAILAPGKQTGETDIKIESMERQPWQITPTFDNQGRPFIGMYRWGTEVSNDSLFGYGDRLLTKYVGASGTQSAIASYYLPINGNGDEIGLNYGFSHVDVDLNTPNPPDITGTAHNLGLSYIHPFDEIRTWVGDIGFQARRVTSMFEHQRSSLDEIRSLQAGLNFNKVDRFGRTFVRSQVSTGLDILGGNAQFFKSELFLTRLFKLPLSNILIIRGYGQYSPDALPSAEEIQIGGAYSVRGYTEGLLIGDRGYNLSIEDRWPIPFLHNVSPWLAERLQGAVFFDMGQTWLDKSNARYITGFSGSSKNTLLLGAGVGLRARMTQYMQAFLDLGFGLANAPEPNAQPTARIHFGIRSNLLPETFRKVDEKVPPVYIQPRQSKLQVSSQTEALPEQISVQAQDDGLKAEIVQSINKQLTPTNSVNGKIGVMQLVDDHY